MFHFSGLCNVLFEWLFFNSWKRRRIRDRARYFVGNSKLKFTLIKPIKIATNRYTTPHMYQKILAEIIHALHSHWIYQSAKDRNYQNFKHFCVDVYSIDHSLNRAFQGQNEQIGLKHWNTETRKHRSGKYVKYTMCNMYNCFRFYWLLYSSTNHIRFFFQNFEGLSWDLALTQSNQLSAEIWRPSAKIFFETSIPY